MSASRSRSGAAVIAAGLLLIAAATPAQGQDAQVERGQEVYERWCASCHGVEGDGLGPAAGRMLPRPRDFTRGLYQIRTTGGGQIPTDADIMRIIDEGMPGTTMPGWEDQLSRQDREAVLAYVKAFYPAFETLAEAEPLDFGSAPRASAERLEEGRVFYDSIECWRCHGDAGRGDGPSAPELEDDWENPIRAVDLTTNWRFNGGGSVEDIYQRLRTGMDGTPMPAFQDLVDGGFMTDDQLWSLAHYVRSLAPEEEPRVREVIRADRAEPDGLPSSVDDERWDEVESFYIPLVGQLIRPPRWFEPRISGVRVQALHDGEEIVFRLTWHDPSESPDPTWMEWQERVVPIMEPEDGEPLDAAPRPDRFTIQFPTEIPEGMERPYFLMGNESEPVYLWQWQSDAEAAQPALARGMTDVEPLDGTLTSEARWEEGRWRLLVRRSLTPEDSGERLTFETGAPIPVAFFAWDGDNGEEGTRGAISSWYFVYLLDEPPVSTYVAPLMAFVLTGGLGVLVVARAQRRERKWELEHSGDEASSGDAPPPDDDAQDHPSHR